MEKPLRLALTYQREPVGELLLGPRAPSERFGSADRRLLEGLARQAGVAAYAVRLTTDLQRSRERLVAAREEERRRLRRDLHDGLGAQLAALNVQAGTLRRLIAHEPAAAQELVVELGEELRGAISEIRRLVYDLRPPALDDLGLLEALRRLAERYGAEGGEQLQVVVEAPKDLPNLPAAVEVAVYRIAQEALTNVVRHAQAKSCIVRLAVMDESVALEILDDGVGIPKEHSAGVGLSSMRERAAELVAAASSSLPQRAVLLGCWSGCRCLRRSERKKKVETLRILIAEDHPLFRKGMVSLLSSVSEFEVVGEAATGEEAVARAADLQPDVVLMDLKMPEVNGIEATRRILKESPSIRILVVTLFEDDDSVFMALRAGARGYVLKDAEEEQMVLAIRAVGRGEAIFSPAIAERVLAYFASAHPAPPQVFPTLTDREREILHLIAQGQPNPSIAKQLHLSTKTVGNYVSNIFTKLQVADRAQAIIRAREAGLG